MEPFKALLVEGTSGIGILLRAGEQFIRVYAQKFGRTPEQIHDYFVREQQRQAGRA